MGDASPTPILEAQDLTVAYGVIVAVRSLSLKVMEGQIVTLIGANGAGKTTLLKALSGLLPVAQGRILYRGQEITGQSPHRIVQRGISQVPEGRMVFANLTVLENLKMGAYLHHDRRQIQQDMDHVFHLFPRLQERIRQEAGTLSGGEQQMLAIGRALMSRPKLLLLDEPSLGMAPLMVKTIFERIVEINRQQGLTIVLVEQNANWALKISHHGYVLETGKIILSAPSHQLREDPMVMKAYLGVT